MAIHNISFTEFLLIFGVGGLFIAALVYVFFFTGGPPENSTIP